MHGLGGSVFSMLQTIEQMVDSRTAVLTFNNRGHDVVSRVKTRGKIKHSTLGGAAFENFEDCVDDIDGAIRFARKQGAKEIYLVGHSTGCQKIAYWAYKRRRGLKGLILLAPMSDYAGILKLQGEARLMKATRTAREMLRKKKMNDLIPHKVWPYGSVGPKRFLSLYTQDSTEQSIFSYFNPKCASTMYSSIRIPILAMFAKNDEYADRRASEIAQWFVDRSYMQKCTAEIIPRANHGFKKREELVARTIKNWMRSVR